MAARLHPEHGRSRYPGPRTSKGSRQSESAHAIAIQIGGSGPKLSELQKDVAGETGPVAFETLAGYLQSLIA